MVTCITVSQYTLFYLTILHLLTYIFSSFLRKVTIRKQMAWQFTLTTVLVHSRNKKSNSKEKANFRFLHASYTRV
jgi:hypothetical protein